MDYYPWLQWLNRERVTTLTSPFTSASLQLLQELDPLVSLSHLSASEGSLSTAIIGLRMATLGWVHVFHPCLLHPRNQLLAFTEAADMFHIMQAVTICMTNRSHMFVNIRVK